MTYQHLYHSLNIHHEPGLTVIYTNTKTGHTRTIFDGQFKTTKALPPAVRLAAMAMVNKAITRLHTHN